ncbi:putative phage abortive infection protein [Mesonia sp. K7]|uniref:putative phage abortive infection protein n=1 Tax=Mesonia sp. K7 TaxID=2218606 RepID=UPI000DA84AA2|nr:putative phage abortive infection protein [Mesonia sp. K7]PZD79333.1 hypothetical protein DNG35_02270 [Mesonia sp. K7]
MLTEKNSKILLWVGLALLLLGVIFFLWKESISFSTKINSNKAAQFGDLIGGIVGSLWSLAGVILFYVALTEQRTDIQINRKALEAQVQALNQQIQEFELQRSELTETRKVFEEQSETLKIQRFENTFFQLLSLHHELIDKLNFSLHEINFGLRNYESREVLSEASAKLDNKIERSNLISQRNSSGGYTYIENPPDSIYSSEERLLDVYKQFYFEDFKQILSHYFRNIYHIFKFIYKSELIINSKKQFYASIVRAQLSSDELFLILYNSLQKDLGYPNFLFLIKEFDIMQNFDFRIIEKHKFHKEIYNNKIKDVKPDFD